MKSIIELKGVSKFYYKNGIVAQGFTKANLKLNIGEFVAITGESGSGKSTLLNIISGLDSYSEGEMYINGEETSHYTERDKENYRRHYIGNIFQTFNLINSYTVYQNIELVLLLNGYKKSEIKEKILSLISKVGLNKFKNSKVSKLSGGQKQRVAIARALAKETPIIIADEPTGNLDSKSAKDILQLLYEISKNKLVVVVTHNYSQIEKYATRKIQMHDGRIIEDKIIKKIPEQNNIELSESKNIRIINKFILGIRNAFNIIPKFVLLLIIFSFITFTLIYEYSNYKKSEYDNNTTGKNVFFNDTSDRRIIVKKDNKTSFSNNDYEKIQEIDNIDYIVKNDLNIDNMISLTDDDQFYLSCYFREISLFKGKISFGRLPLNDNEIIALGSKNDYNLNTMRDKLVESNLYIYNYYNGETNKNESYKIVGIAYDDNSQLLNTFSNNITIYGADILGKKLLIDATNQYSDIKILFQDKYYELEMNYFKISLSNKVTSGTVYLNEELNYMCPKGNCKNEKFIIKTNNIYYEDSISLKVDSYNKNNLKKLLGNDNTDMASNYVYINPNDYNKLFDKDAYQSSIYVKNSREIDNTINSLQNMGYKVLKISDTLIQSEDGVIILLFQLIVMIVIFIVLFFISYFIIKIILKSRSIYYSTIRMLGANEKICKQLLIIDLLVIATCGYLLVITFNMLINNNVIEVSKLKTMLNYMQIKDYLLFYFILVSMTYLLCMRYSRKVFKETMISAYREEV